jgi:hypothetical protein
MLAARVERDPDAELGGAPGNQVSQHAVESRSSKNQRDHRKPQHQDRVELRIRRGLTNSLDSLAGGEAFELSMLILWSLFEVKRDFRIARQRNYRFFTLLAQAENILRSLSRRNSCEFARKR